MRRILFTTTVLLLVLVSNASAGYGSGDDRLESLYATFVAPCCWRDNLAIHQSARADELRDRIKDMVDAGRSDEQIKAAMVQEFGRRILVVPEGSGRGWLFRTPWFLAVAGLAIVVVFLRRMRHRAPPLVPEEL
jgi:cytochrome c-type biogenesis protein CcmH